MLLLAVLRGDTRPSQHDKLVARPVFAIVVQHGGVLGPTVSLPHVQLLVLKALHSNPDFIENYVARLYPFLLD